MASQLRVGQKIALAITALAIVLVLILVFLSVAKRNVPLPLAFIPLPLAIYSVRLGRRGNSISLEIAHHAERRAIPLR
jgi:integral membrane sensor domain MASE1